MLRKEYVIQALLEKLRADDQRQEILIGFKQGG